MLGNHVQLGFCSKADNCRVERSCRILLSIMNAKIMELTIEHQSCVKSRSRSRYAVVFQVRINSPGSVSLLIAVVRRIKCHFWRNAPLEPLCSGGKRSSAFPCPSADGFCDSIHRDRYIVAAVVILFILRCPADIQFPAIGKAFLARSARVIGIVVGIAVDGVFKRRTNADNGKKASELPHSATQTNSATAVILPCVVIAVRRSLDDCHPNAIFRLPLHAMLEIEVCLTAARTSITFYARHVDLHNRLMGFEKPWSQHGFSHCSGTRMFTQGELANAA